MLIGKLKHWSIKGVIGDTGWARLFPTRVNSKLHLIQIFGLIFVTLSSIYVKRMVNSNTIDLSFHYIEVPVIQSFNLKSAVNQTF